MSADKIEATAGSDGAIDLSLPAGLLRHRSDRGVLGVRVKGSPETEWGTARVYLSIDIEPAAHFDLHIPSSSARALGNALIDQASRADMLPPTEDLRDTSQEREEIATWNAR